MSDHDAMRWGQAARVCREAMKIIEEVESRTVFCDFAEPVELVLLGSPLVVERDGECVVACNVCLMASMRVRVVEFTLQEFSVFVDLRSKVDDLSGVLWAVQRSGDGVACVMHVDFLTWFEAEDKKTLDLEAMYGSAALDKGR